MARLSTMTLSTSHRPALRTVEMAFIRKRGWPSSGQEKLESKGCVPNPQNDDGSSPLVTRRLKVNCRQRLFLVHNGILSHV